MSSEPFRSSRSFRRTPCAFGVFVFGLSLGLWLPWAGEAFATTTTRLSAVADSTIRQQQANQNRGDDEVIRVGWSQGSRALVRFDSAAISAAIGSGTLVSAHLELWIEETGESWSGSQAIGAHRLTQDWTERGVTWNCAIDSRPNDNRSDCAPRWNGGTFVASPTASVAHTKSKRGLVRWEVTPDVLAYVAGSPHYGWLLKKANETLSGRVDYTSREGEESEEDEEDDEGERQANHSEDLDLGPRLVLVVATNGDITPPTITITSPSEGTTRGDTVLVAADYADGGAGIDLASVQLSIDGVALSGCTIEAARAACPSPRLLAGPHTATVTVRDLAGNQASANRAFVIAIDTLAPTITAAVAPPANAAGWHRDSVTVTFTCSDDSGSVSFCSPPATVSNEGIEEVTGYVVDSAGLQAEITVTLRLDRTPPTIDLESPAAGVSTNDATITVQGTASDANGLATITLNGQPLSLAGDHFTASVSLGEGTNSIELAATDPAGNSASTTLDVRRFSLPTIAITAPATATLTRSPTIAVSGTTGSSTTHLEINGTPANVAGGGWNAPVVPLLEGNNTLTAVATDGDGHVAMASILVIRDSRPPRVTVAHPPSGFVTFNDTVEVTGLVNDLIVGSRDIAEASVSVNGTPAQVSNRTFLAAGVPLALGINTLTLTATDVSGNVGSTTVSVERRAATGPRLVAVSGNLQNGTIATELAEPLIVELHDGSGAPIAGRSVVFRVVENDGTVQATGAASRSVVATTDAQGQARVRWRLGQRAGAGENRVEASAVGVLGLAGEAGRVSFLGTGVTAAPAAIHLDSGNRQFGVVGQALARPLVAVVTDFGHNRLAGVPVTFTIVEGEGTFPGASTTTTVATDAYGRALAVLTLGSEEGLENNVVESSFAGNAAAPATFVATGNIAGDPAATRISGVVLDNSDQPIAGVTLRVEETGVEARSDALGQFTISPAPVGRVRLIVDGSTAARPGHWPSLNYELSTIAGRDNGIGMPIYLLPLDLAHGVLVDETHGGNLTLPAVPGFSLTIAPGSATFPNGSRSGVVSATLVHLDKVPMIPNFGQQPRFVITIQPSGVRFDPPAALTMPNVDGLAPGEITEMYSFDHDLGMFVSIGTASVSADGTTLRSDPGTGVVEGGWHCGGNPATTGGAEPPFVRVTSARKVKIKRGEVATITANGGPPVGTYEWTTDHPDVISFQGPTTGESVSSVAIVALKSGHAKVRVKFTCRRTGAVAIDEITVLVASKDVVVIGWVDPSPIDLNALAANANLLLRTTLNFGLTCGYALANWLGGMQTVTAPLLTEGDKHYANGFLLKNSPNNRPPNHIDPAAVLAAQDFRLFNRLQVFVDDVGGAAVPEYLQAQVSVGPTPDPCGLVPRSGGESHPTNGSRGVTAAGNTFQLAQGRLGHLGQYVDMFINDCHLLIIQPPPGSPTPPVALCDPSFRGKTTPWIYSVIRFDRNASHLPVLHQIFPTYFVYEDGDLVQQFPQNPAENFIALDDTAFLSPGAIP